MNIKKLVLPVIAIGLVLFLLIQVIPIDRTNPATSAEPKWSSPEARALVKQYCFQCHSNETSWPWYSYVAPASWLIRWDVVNGRAHLNFSEWDKRRGEVDEMAENIQRGSMPPLQYTMFHPEAVLSADKKQALIDAISSSMGR